MRACAKEGHIFSRDNQKMYERDLFKSIRVRFEKKSLWRTKEKKN